METLNPLLRDSARDDERDATRRHLDVLMDQRSAVFGEQRLFRPDVGSLERLYFRLLGLADPAHHLHGLYFERALKELGVDQPEWIFDAGCGRGDYSLYVARRFPNARVVGWDIDEQAIARNVETARIMGLTNVEFVAADLATLDFENHFDFVLSVDVLEHLPEQKLVLKKIARALKPGGSAFYHIPTVRPKAAPLSRFLKEFNEWAEDEHIADDLTHEQFREVVEESGLEIRSLRQTFGYFSGELANSLFVLPYRNTPINRVFQVGLSPFCRLLAKADPWGLDSPRYAVAVACVKGRSAA